MYVTFSSICSLHLHSNFGRLHANAGGYQEADLSTWKAHGNSWMLGNCAAVGEDTNTSCTFADTVEGENPWEGPCQSCVVCHNFGSH